MIKGIVICVVCFGFLDGLLVRLIGLFVIELGNSDGRLVGCSEVEPETQGVADGIS